MNEYQKPRLIIVAGPNGAGRTSITEQLLRHEWMTGCVYVNPDLIARDQFGDWNSPASILKAAQLAAEIREQCLRQRKNLAFETVLSAPDKVDFIHRAKLAGYFVRLFFVVIRGHLPNWMGLGHLHLSCQCNNLDRLYLVSENRKGLADVL